MTSKTIVIPVNILETMPDFDKVVDGIPEYKEVTTKKTVTFKALDQRDKEQHDLHFLIMAHYTSGAAKSKGKNKVMIDHRFALDIVMEFMESMVVYSEEFKLSDKELVLTDSAALMMIGNTLIGDHVIPFFFKLMESMTK